MSARFAGSWSSSAIRFSDVTQADVDVCTSAYNELSHLTYADPVFKTTSRDDIAALIQESISREGDFQMQLMQKESDLLGYFHMKHQFPKADVLLITMFFIRPSLHERSLGREALSAILATARESGYGEVWTKVSLLNWPAIRFWSSNCFDRIVEVHGDRIFRPGAASSVVMGYRCQSNASKSS